MMTNYEREEKFKQINALLAEVMADEAWLENTNDIASRAFRNGVIKSRLVVASENLNAAKRLIDIRQGTIEP